MGFPIPTADSQPRGIITGPDGNLWFAEYNGSQIGRITPSGQITEFALSPDSGPHYLTAGPNNSDKIGRLYVRTPANRFLITASATAVSGTPFDVTVTALDPYGKIDTNYQGTVTFSTSDPDSGVVLPADYTFSTGDGADNGVHTFPAGVTLMTVGDQTLTGTDTVSGSTGSATVTVGPGP